MRDNRDMDQQTVQRPAGPPPRTRRRRGGAFYVGLLLVLVGLGLLGYVGWEFFGTNIVARHEQQQAVHQLRQTWRQEAHAADESRPASRSV